MPICPFHRPDPQQREIPSQSNRASGPRLASRSMWRRPASTNGPAAAPGPAQPAGPAPFAPRAPRGSRSPIAPPPAAGSAASSLLKRYRPLETRAAGGFGSVEICLDSRLQRRVAIKRMPLASPDARTPLETTAAALAEARTASMLQHPKIVQVIDFTYDSAHAYLVMDYVDGMTLEEFLQQVEGHSLTYDEAAGIPDAAEQALLDALSPSPYARMPSVAEFGDAFLARLGTPREGRKSLARIIARLTSDDTEDARDPADGRAERVWELDPDTGYLGTRFPRAREYALGAVTGVAVAAVSWALLGDLQVGGAAVRAITAAGIGVWETCR